MAQVIIIGEAVAQSTTTTITLDGNIRTKPIKTINSAMQLDISSATAATALAVVTTTPTGADQIQLLTENSISVDCDTAAMVAADMIVMDVTFVDELIRT